MRAACAAARATAATAEVEGARLVTMQRRRGPFVTLGPPPGAFYHAPTLDGWPSEAEVAQDGGALGRLLDLLQRRAHAVTLSLPPREDGVLSDVRPLAWRGFRCEVKYTYRLPLGPSDAVRAAMGATARRALRASPDPFAPASGADLASAVVDAYHRHERRPPLSRDGLAALADASATASLGRIVRVGDAVALVLGLDSAPGPAPCLALNGGLGLAPLVWSLATEAHARGHRWLDLVGANTPSIAEAKRRLGAVLVPYVRATWHRPGLARAVAALRPLV